jgi:hypothetical protein
MAPDPETLPTASWKKERKYKKKICELPLAHPRISVTSICIKRDLRMWKKRPTYVAKETEAYLPDLGCYSASLRSWVRGTALPSVVKRGTYKDTYKVWYSAGI